MERKIFTIKQTMKKIFSQLLVATLVIGGFAVTRPMTAMAATQDGVAYIIPGVTATQYANSVTVIASDADITGTLTAGWYLIEPGVTINHSGAITVSGDVNLILGDGSSLTVTGYSGNAGISVIVGNCLTIYAQSVGTGTLTANGGGGAAGVGGGSGGAGGTVVINGGVVTAIGGTVTATGGAGSGSSGGGGAGIGGRRQRQRRRRGNGRHQRRHRYRSWRRGQRQRRGRDRRRR